MSLIKLSAGNDQYWLMNDIPHQRGQFDVSAKIGSDVVEIYSLNTLKSLARANYDEFSPDGITPYASTQALIDDLKTFFFHSVTGGGGGGDTRTTVVNPTSPYVPNTGDVILWDTTSGNKVLNLPAASASTNYVIDIKKTDNSINTITVDPNGAELIEGGTTAVLTTQYESISIVCDGTQWWVIAAI